MMSESEATPAPVGGSLFSRILMGILGLLLGLLISLATFYRLTEIGWALSSDIPDEFSDQIRIMQMLFKLVAALCLAIIVSSIATFINTAWAPKALLGSTVAMCVLLLGCGIYEYIIIDAVYGDQLSSEEIPWRYKPMTTISMLMAYISLFFGGLIWLIDYLRRGKDMVPAATEDG
ncbi:MAG: hypothetical protein BEU05_02815 [Marine Group III euryarchaeote CG-Bathy2]|uniref:Uncharacterized protein n=1 Tax=Marine Group III euryarchaeote CG-Bathy2 TaxID=1889002 RepID=A0A1J5T9G7_9ARCH|nr:MAG: hypothetical protein BEU05_02815 [Marine Group III euryarchaeote CG-Bathy2]